MTPLEKKSFVVERRDLLRRAKGEKDPFKTARLLIKAAKIAVKLGEPEHGMRELDGVVKRYGTLHYGDASGEARMIQARWCEKKGKWRHAERYFSEIWGKYRGSYGDKGCEAAKAVAIHYESVGDLGKAARFMEIVIECGGSYTGPAGEACLWFAEQYLKAGDKAHALVYLRKVIDDYPGPYDKWKLKAQEMIDSLR